MQWLAELCVKRPVFATVLSLVILVVGSVFYTKLGVDHLARFGTLADIDTFITDWSSTITNCAIASATSGNQRFIRTSAP